MRNNQGDNVLFRVLGKNEKLVEEASLLPDEYEVLFRAGTVFEVRGVRKIVDPRNGTGKIFEIILKKNNYE